MNAASRLRVRRLRGDLALKTPIWSAASSSLLLVTLLLVGILAPAASDSFPYSLQHALGNSAQGRPLGRMKDLFAADACLSFQQTIPCPYFSRYSSADPATATRARSPWLSEVSPSNVWISA
jgi:hypothetical protein